MGVSSASRYRRELGNLERAYAAALSLDIAPLATAIEGAASRPAVTIGSGGSYSVASFAAFLHQLHTGRLATVSTPLDYLNLPIRDAAVLCFSASGRNKDIAAAFHEAACREARPLVGLVMRTNSPLHELGSKFQYARIVSASSDWFKDGFLAVGSLLASCMLLMRAYRELVGQKMNAPKSLSDLVASIASTNMEKVIATSTLALECRTTSVLYTASLKPASVDIESRFVEAALGNVQTADLRNFGHGRHHWFAKRAGETGIVALIGDQQKALATRTLELVPKAVPRVRFDLTGERDLQALVGLVISLYLAASAGAIHRIDPAKPGVPSFGRRLYHLGPTRSGAVKSDIAETAAWRKANASPARSSRDPKEWYKLCKMGIGRLERMRLKGIVFDYDGTLCETRLRYEPLQKDIAKSISNLMRSGAVVGVATGRGGSAAERLREALPRDLWSRVIVGFYNGAVVGRLSDEPPNSSGAVNQEIRRLEEALKASIHFARCAFRTNEQRIAISLPVLEEPTTSVRTVTNIVHRAGLFATVTCSNHSIDILFGSARKTAVVDSVRQLAAAPDEAPILRIGDKGCWPGNDAELLDDPCGLSVDEISASTDSCWGLSPRGILGVQATRYYLDRVRWERGAGVLDLS